jgi:4'-phosphopantetheinyl transferase
MDVLWMEQVQADVPAHNDWLSADEIIRLRGMRIPKRRADWLLGRWTAKWAVAQVLALASELHWFTQAEIRSAASGAPEFFVRNQRADLTISLSHRGEFAACSVARGKIALGCDIELIEPHSEAFLADYFSAEEQHLVRSHGADRDFLLALLWSAKESALKALETGLRAHTCSVVACPDISSSGRGAWARLLVGHTSGRVFNGWWQRSGDLIRTLVADPIPSAPVFLSSERAIELIAT